MLVVTLVKEFVVVREAVTIPEEPLGEPVGLEPLTDLAILWGLFKVPLLMEQPTFRQI